MQIGHVAVYVADLEQTLSFYQKYFEATHNAKYINPRTGLQTYFLTFAASGAKLEIMTRPNLGKIVQGGNSLGLVHIAFNVGAPDKVDELFKRMTCDGVETVSPPRTTGDGYYEAVVKDCNGIIVEMVADTH